LKAVGSELVRYKNITDRARHVSRHLARSYAAEDMPGMSTVRNYLAEHAVAKNPAKNPAKNSTRAKIAS
jgi:hypothetical protein